MKAWHFVRGNRRLRFGHRGTVAAGYVYAVEGQIALCEWGLHASVRPIDALRYASGAVICRVKMGGEIIKGDDLIVAQTREVIWMADATSTLHEFARVVADGALKAKKVKDERSWAAITAKRRRVAGEITAGDLAAAWDAVRDAAWDAAEDAASAVAWESAWESAVDRHNAILLRMLSKLETAS